MKRSTPCTEIDFYDVEPTTEAETRDEKFESDMEKAVAMLLAAEEEDDDDTVSDNFGQVGYYVIVVPTTF
jgi:hypothetical protein